jgi:LPXTG-motif cell wall-anchored protein
MQYKYIPFLVVGIVFIAIGGTGNRTLLFVGFVFIALALVIMFRKRGQS